jgi:hypothetical protein
MSSRGLGSSAAASQADRASNRCQTVGRRPTDDGERRSGRLWVGQPVDDQGK